ncbi:MAG: hypothetical protein ACRDI0_13675 [Actinomycetota bacterium]
MTGIFTERNGCLLLRSNGEEVLALWEEGYSYADGTLLDSSGRSVVGVGEALHCGGGYGSDWQHAESLIAEPIPDRCRRQGAEPWVLIYDVQAGPPAD